MKYHDIMATRNSREILRNIAIGEIRENKFPQNFSGWHSRKKIPAEICPAAKISHRENMRL